MTEPTTTEAEAPDQTDEKAPQEPQEPAEGAASPAAAPEAAEPQSVDEAAETLGTMVVHHETPAGSLTLRPNQKALDPEQHAALKAIGIDTQADPGVIPHVRAFVHMCQIRGLDPFAREAYLIGRGKGDNRKYTMQTGIDGYRKMGYATGRFIRVKKVLWTGRDDDDRSFVKVEDEDGDVVMKRVWYDQWPADRGNPGAAKVVIEHFDEDGQVTTTGAIANWEMYAPYNDLWEYDPSQRKRAQKYDENRQPIKVLGEMWQKGGPHMLAKCAEALAYRMAFPAKMSGVYITEEMHRLDGQERDRRQREQQDARRLAMARAQGHEPQPGEPVDEDGVVDAVLVEEPSEPTPAAEAVAETVQAVVQDEDEARRLLRLELQWQSDVLDQKPEALARRRVAALRKNLDDFTAAELHPVVNGLRSLAVEAARRTGQPDTEAYAAVAVDGAGPIDVDALSPEDAASDVDPNEEHLFVATNVHGKAVDECFTCGLPEGVGNHPEGEES